MVENSNPDRNAADEQREADERRRFLQDCAQDGLTGMDSAEPTEPYGIVFVNIDDRAKHAAIAVALANAATKAAAARERVERSFHSGPFQDRNVLHEG